MFLAQTITAWAVLDRINIGFESSEGYVLGDVAPNLLPSYLGNQPNNTAPWTLGAANHMAGFVTNNVAHSGTQSLLLTSRGNFSGAIEQLGSPRLDFPGGEPGTFSTGYTGLDPAGTQAFAGSLWFRTASTTPLPYVGNGRIAALIPDGSLEQYGGIIYVVNSVPPNEAAGLRIDYSFGSGTTAGYLVPWYNLNWGDWYQLFFTANLRPGPLNDITSLSLFDSSGTQVGSTVYGTTRENAPATDVAINRWLFREWDNYLNQDLLYIDDVFLTSVPEPGAAALLALGVLLLVSRRRG